LNLKPRTGPLEFEIIFFILHPSPLILSLSLVTPQDTLSAKCLNPAQEVFTHMFEWDVDGRHFVIREAQCEAEYHAVEEIQRLVWEFSELDIVPAATLIATQHAGGMVLGAFEGDKMIGFAHGFPAFEHGRASIHSHMLAVLPEYRNVQLGFNLKLAQRDFVLAKGLDEITWTYDPLQSLNAHLNFGKLGVISRRYIVNFYGEETSSPMHQGFGTDRLWVNWLLTSERVEERLAGHKQATRPADSAFDANSLSPAYQSALVYKEDGQPKLADFSSLLSSSRCFIEIPHDISALKQRDAAASSAWREATRAAFLAAIEAGFTVQDVLRDDAQQSPRWFYLLSR
jgi:predicted GNAT superfamily acetyltransferase